VQQLSRADLRKMMMAAEWGKVFTSCIYLVR
jgi:hypothetical protein